MRSIDNKTYYGPFQDRCMSLQYILNPNTDACQACPPGLKCSGTAVVTPVIANSTWVRKGAIYQLTGCPAGYSVSSAGASGAFDATVQQCSTCARGQECVSPPCVTCSPCRPGFYKPFASASACAACPVGTYNPISGAQNASACLPCQAQASTQGLTGQTSQAACKCNSQYFSSSTSGSLVCSKCPKGMFCVRTSRYQLE